MAHACLVEGAACDRPSLPHGNYEEAPAGPSVDAAASGGGLATALVAALVLVGVMIARGLFDVPVLAPTDEGTLGNASTLRLAVFAAVAALLATGLLHAAAEHPAAPRFFTWIITLATLAAALVPFLTSADLDEKIAPRRSPWWSAWPSAPFCRASPAAPPISR